MKQPLDGPYSDAAETRWQAILDKEARGELISWTDIRGICEPHPDRTDCQSWWDVADGPQCSLQRGHEGPHRAELEW